ncbi:MAG: hypothetical protein JSW59_17820 [Phycisphaerales bacterium]|nr:MAG: hypothetical protein JSW59_17820 [Phycisphaerales bacterium]
MLKSRLIEQIADKETDKHTIAERVIDEPGLLSELYKALGAKEARIKYGSAKILRIVSDTRPELLYPRFDFFADLLDSDNKIMQWQAIYVIANLARVDCRNKFEKIFDKYFAPISGPVMITAANVINAGAKIARARPELTDRITAEILKVGHAKYQTPECRNIALGHAIRSFDQFFDQIQHKRPVVRLIKRQLKNARSATRKKAEKFLARHVD